MARWDSGQEWRSKRKEILSEWLCGRGTESCGSSVFLSWEQRHVTEEKALEFPGKPNTLEELEVVAENFVEVQEINEEDFIIWFMPTVLHCSLEIRIGLCSRVKLQRGLKNQLEIYISEGTHSTEEDINKKINEKEREAAAMEDPNLLEIVEQLHH